VINGFNVATGTQTSWYVGATANTPVKNLKVGVAYDYLGTSDNPNNVFVSGYANALALYTSFRATEKMSLHVRGEYAWTDTTLLGTGTGFANGNSEIFSLTGTIQYDLWANVLSRLEIRWDHQAGDGEMLGYGGEFGGGGSGTPIDQGSLRNAVMVAANIIYKF
jgi:hypothetical protein